MSQFQATLESYLDQWNQYFEGANSGQELLSRLRHLAFEGELRSCKFRSVCWRIFLGCLPGETSEWKTTIEKSRQRYVEIKNKHVTKPSHENEGKDLEVENPLSQSDQSSWLKFFKNSELKTMIERDVRRTFPEMEYFHNEKVHELLVNVLFCYAREHKDLSYRQGMHELLAPLVFVIHCDLQAACHAREIGELKDMINLILDTDFLEHDSYDMFCHLMESTNVWYSITERGRQEMREEEENLSNRERSKSENDDLVPTKLFQPQEIATGNGPTLAITNKLNHIHNTLLVQHDLQLHTHLNRLEIIPQVFGLRWIRLLFGREFSLQDLLVLWDAMFADSQSLDLVDYLFVAMLIHIRHHLLDSDYSTCMQILMKYPPVDDINDIVKAAKEIRQLKEKSFSESLMENFAQNPPEASQIPRKRLPAPRVQQPTNKQSSISKLFKDFTRKVIPANTSIPPPHSSLNDPTHAGHSPAQVRQASRPRQLANGSDAAYKPRRLLREAPRPEEMCHRNPSQLEEEVSALHHELDKLKQMCLYCSEKIASSVTILQSNVSLSYSDNENGSDTVRHELEEATQEKEQKTFEKEQILLAVASLKQVRDLLQGSLTFNPNLREYIIRKQQEEKDEEHENVNGHETAADAPKSVANENALNHEAGDT